MAENEKISDMDTAKTGSVKKRFKINFLSIEMTANLLLLAGVVLFLWGSVILFQHAASIRAAEQADLRVVNSKQLIDEQVSRMLGLLQNPELHGLIRAGLALTGTESTEADVQDFLRERDPGIYLARIMPVPLSNYDPAAETGTGYIIYEILLEAHLTTLAPLQVLNPGTTDAVLVGAVRIDQEQIPVAYLHVYWSVRELLDNFPIGGLLENFMALQQQVGERIFSNIKSRGNAPLGLDGVQRLAIDGTQIFVALPPAIDVEPLLAQTDLVMSMILGALLWSVGLILRRRALAPKAAPIQLEADPVVEEAEVTPEKEIPATVFAQPNKPVKKKLLTSGMQETQVELTPGIFRAYDIRGIVGVTIDTGVARQIGQD